MKLFATIPTRFLPFLLLIFLMLAAPNESVAQSSRAKTGKSSSARSASKRKTTKAAKKGRSKKYAGAKGKTVAKRKKPTAKGKTTTKTAAKTAVKTNNTAAAMPKKAKPAVDENSAPRYATNGSTPSDIAYSTARSNPNTVSNSVSMSPSEPISMRSVLEKTDQEILQELFGFDASNRDTAFMSPYWLGQMRFTIPEQYAKIFPKESVYEDSRKLTIYEMDATQRILPISKHYEGYVVTAHTDPKHYYLYLYDRIQKRMISTPQKIASEYTAGAMHYKTYSYIFEDGSGKLKMMNCTRSARVDNDTCTVSCAADYRVEGLEFNGASWQTKYVVQQFRTGTKVTSSNVSCGDGSLRSNLEARANAFISYYFRKKE